MAQNKSRFRRTDRAERAERSAEAGAAARTNIRIGSASSGGARRFGQPKSESPTPSDSLSSQMSGLNVTDRDETPASSAPSSRFNKRQDSDNEADRDLKKEEPAAAKNDDDDDEEETSSRSKKKEGATAQKVSQSSKKRQQRKNLREKRRSTGVVIMPGQPVTPQDEEEKAVQENTARNMDADQAENDVAMDNQDGGSGDASSELEAYKQAIEEWKDAYEKAQKEIDTLRNDNMRLKDENSALLRVVGSLSGSSRKAGAPRT